MSITDLDQHAAELHRRALIIDGHSDILMSLADRKTRLGERAEIPDWHTWDAPPDAKAMAGDALYGFSAHTYYFGPMGQYDIPRFLEGGLTAQVCAIYLRDNDLERALQRGLEMTWWLHKEAEDNPRFEVITTVEDLRRVKAEGKCGGILSFEGFEPLGFELRFLDLWYKLGLRMASLTHSRRNFFGDGTQRGVQTGGLTDAGKEAVKRMNELGIVVDLGHLNQVGFWEIIELSTQPVVFSHTAPRRYFAADGGAEISRKLGTDLSRGRERLEAIARSGGVVGVIFYGQETLDDVVADIEYLLDVIGPDHVGLGSDYYGLERTPLGLEDMSRLPALTRRLIERGHSDECILKILGENYLRVFEQVWKK